ncbi:hypothetical protein EVAR_58092_1 [Eumeta japonica]|uniref:Uncharacterized protein n=1 Tax=Eumeta variegata TaxID=151549 RepID=A0A4C1YK63_EUMVA|nr:hypothetical protein EVAR_58092_1 [Eumeta japonica]
MATAARGHSQLRSSHQCVASPLVENRISDGEDKDGGERCNGGNRGLEGAVGHRNSHVLDEVQQPILDVWALPHAHGRRARTPDYEIRLPLVVALHLATRTLGILRLLCATFR